MAPPITIHRIIPKLELNKLHDDELIEYTMEKIAKINAANGIFPPGGIMLFEDGGVMQYEDGALMAFEG